MQKVLRLAPVFGFIFVCTLLSFSTSYASSDIHEEDLKIFGFT